jgi:GTP pyrophosphokinase
VITGKAIGRIRHALKEEKRELAQDGKDILRNNFSKYKIEFNDDNVNKLVHFFKTQSQLDLYYDIQRVAIPAEKLVIDAIVTRRIPQLKKERQENDVSPAFKSLKNAEIIVGDDVDLPYSFAQCCNPIPGDDIFGFITIGEGVKIHRTNCPNSVSLVSNYGYRIIKAKWKDKPALAGSKFLAGIRIKGIDDVGIISSLTDIISRDMQVNMKSITVEGGEGTFTGEIMLFISDTEHLTGLISKIKNKHPHMEVSRMDL